MFLQFMMAFFFNLLVSSDQDSLKIQRLLRMPEELGTNKSYAARQHKIPEQKSLIWLCLALGRSARRRPFQKQTMNINTRISTGRFTWGAPRLGDDAWTQWTQWTQQLESLESLETKGSYFQCANDLETLEMHLWWLVSCLPNWP